MMCQPMYREKSSIAYNVLYNTIQEVNFLISSTRQFHPLLLESRHRRHHHYVPVHTVVNNVPTMLVVTRIFLAFLVECNVEQNSPVFEVNPSDA